MIKSFPKYIHLSKKAVRCNANIKKSEKVQVVWDCGTCQHTSVVRWRTATGPQGQLPLSHHLGVGVTKGLKSQVPLGHSSWGASSCPALPSKGAPVCPCVSLTSTLAKIVQNSFHLQGEEGGGK